MKIIQHIVIVLVLAVFTGCSSHKKPEEIPFEYGTHIYIKAMIDDTIPGTFMFDTGAYGLCLDSTFNENSGLRYGPPPYYDPPGTGPVITYKLKFTAGSFSFHPQGISVLHTKPSFGKQCDGIVGWEWLKDKVVKVDYLKKAMTVIDPDDFSPDDSFTKVPLKMLRTYFMINADVAVTKDIHLKGDYVFDLGCGTAIFMSGQITKKYNLRSMVTQKCEWTEDWGVMEKIRSQGFIVRGKSITTNGFEIKEPLFDCALDTSGVLSSPEFLGLMGNDFWDHFDLTIDFPHKILYLKPNSDYNTKMVFRMSGVGSVDRTDICEGRIINSIYRGTDADSLGIRSGDIITHFNDIPVKGMSKEQEKEIFPNRDNEIIYTIKRDTSILKFKLRRREMLK